jgi:hypothetical protein
MRGKPWAYEQGLTSVTCRGAKSRSIETNARKYIHFIFTKWKKINNFLLARTED